MKRKSSDLQSTHTNMIIAETSSHSINLLAALSNISSPFPESPASFDTTTLVFSLVSRITPHNGLPRSLDFHKTSQATNRKVIRQFTASMVSLHALCASPASTFPQIPHDLWYFTNGAISHEGWAFIGW
jgi:hypothetical protein